MSIRKSSRLGAEAEVERAILEAAIRYQQLTGAVIHGIAFLAALEASGRVDPPVMNAMAVFEKYLKPQNQRYEGFFAGMLLTNIVAEVEAYLVSVAKALLKRHPKKLGSHSFSLLDVLERSPDELILVAAEEKLTKLMYKRPNEYRDEVANLLGVDSSPFQESWPHFVEGKARRDLGVHNSWAINDTYRRKLSEVGLNAAQPTNDDLQPDFQYLFVLLEHCDKIVRSISRQLEEKYVRAP